MTQKQRKILKTVGKSAKSVGKGVGYGVIGAVSVATGIVALPLAWAALQGLFKTVLKPHDAEKEKSKEVEK